jgi:hypothetical protein
MTLDRELTKEACAQFWNEYHSVVENLGYTLEKESFMLATDGISLVATIDPAFSQKMWKKFRKVLPKQYTYKSETFPVIIFPSFNNER